MNPAATVAEFHAQIEMVRRPGGLHAHRHAHGCCVVAGTFPHLFWNWAWNMAPVLFCASWMITPRSPGHRQCEQRANGPSSWRLEARSMALVDHFRITPG